jgi:hypothetical protein
MIRWRAFSRERREETGRVVGRGERGAAANDARYAGHRARRRRASKMLDRVVNTRGLVPGRPAPRAGCRASPPSSPRHERSATRPPRLRTRSNAAPPPGRVALTDSRPRRVIRTLSSKDTDQRGALGCDALAARAHGHRRASGAQGEGQTTAQGKSPYVVPLRDSDFLREDARREQLDAANRGDSKSAVC